jgi:cyclase
MSHKTTHRLIGKIEIKNGFVIKGLMMEGVQKVGDPISLAKKYYDDGIDELILLDTVASLYQRLELPDIISNILKHTFLPICAGGGISSLEDAELLFRSGADKICVNSSAISNPKLLNQLSSRFGAQSIVSQIDVKFYNNNYMVFFNTGRELSQYTFEEWLSIVQNQGVGEVLLTSIDKDGLSKGVDINLIKIARSLCNVPLIYSGGVNKISHIENIFNHNFEACAIASALHFNNLNTKNLKNDLVKKNIMIRN